MRRAPAGRAVALALVGLAFASAGHAQQVRFRGVGDPDLDARVLRFVAEGGYTLITADTTVALGDTLPGPLLVLRARLSIAGTVAGDIMAVDANVFVRPTGLVSGEVWNLGGGFYPSELARFEGDIEDHPLAPYRVDRQGSLFVIVGLAHEAEFVPDGLYGLGGPTYDRVDGLSVPLGARWLLPPLGRVRPTLRGRVVYRSERGAWDGGGFLELTRGRTSLRLGGERATHTSDAWVRADLFNSASYLIAGRDMRDYYQADRFYARLELRRSPGPWTLRPFVEARREDAGALRADDPWTLFDLDSVRPNRPIVEAVVNSVTLGAVADWRDGSSALDVDVQVELGSPGEQGTFACPVGDCPLAPGDLPEALALFAGENTFARITVDGAWESPALDDHRLRLGWHLQGPIGSDGLPFRRWSHVGGPGTLPTLGDAQRQGDRVVFVRSGYGIPLPFAVPPLGALELELVHMFGGAWSAAGDDRLDQNVGVRLHFALGWVRVVTDPDDFGEDVVVDVGVRASF